MYFSKSNYELGKLIKSGKANDVYEAVQPHGVVTQSMLLIQSSNRISANDGERKAKEVPYKGEANNLFSCAVFAMMHMKGLPTHYIGAKDSVTKLVRRVDMLPVEVIIREIAAGSFCKRYQVREGYVFSHPYIEFTFKCDETHDPLITEDAMVELGMLERHEITQIRELCNAALPIIRKVADGCGTKLYDLKLEFGKYDGKILIADEISPDTCRLRDKETGCKLDKDPFRNGASVEETSNGYQVMRGRAETFIKKNSLFL